MSKQKNLDPGVGVRGARAPGTPSLRSANELGLILLIIKNYLYVTDFSTNDSVLCIEKNSGIFSFEAMI